MGFTVAELAKLCDAVYSKDLSTRQKLITPGVHEKVFDDGTIDTLAAAGTGFHGACYVKEEDAAIVFAGTNFKSSKDLSADLSMAAGRVPSQANRAADLVGTYGSWAKTHAGVKNFMVSGHSLGGALTQLVATAMELPFVTFNAYGADGLAKDGSNAIGQVAKWSKGGAEGINVRADWDPVSKLSGHIGKVITIATGGAVLKAHSITPLAEFLESKHAGAKPFADEPFN